MSRRVTLACFEVPGWGGASTSAYRLYESLRADGLEASFINLVAPDDAVFFRHFFGERAGNPRRLPDVHDCLLERATYGEQPRLSGLLRELRPDLLVGIGWIAALLIKRAARAVPSIYLTTGCEQAKLLVARKKIRSYVALERYLRKHGAPAGHFSEEEYRAVIEADLVITHSESTRFLYDAFFPRFRGKIHRDVIWFAEWIRDDALRHVAVSRPFAERDIDALFLASSWSRPEKNYRAVERVARRLDGASVHVVGEVPTEIRGVTHHGLVTAREEVFSLMGRARTVVCPSTFDAAPGILFEASALGSNVVGSRNCGNWKLCHPSLLAEPFDPGVLLRKILLSRDRRFDDNVEYFLQGKSYSRLREILEVF